jgi:hypothetical protein
MYTVYLNPQGTYLFTDVYSGIKNQDDTYTPDVSVPPSSFDLSFLFDDPNINLKEGDIITLEQIGAFKQRPSVN